MFRTHAFIIRRSKLHYTASGIITSIGGRLVHETATYTCYDTRGCVMQFWLPDDEHMCSKHVEAWKKLIVKQKFCASNWLITEINILRCTISKTSKNVEVCSQSSLWCRYGTVPQKACNGFEYVILILCTVHLLLFCTTTNQCTIISQIITLLHVSTLSCHPQGACNQYLAKLYQYFNTCTVHILLLCTMTNKHTIISQIITLLHVSTLSCHPQGAW